MKVNHFFLFSMIVLEFIFSCDDNSTGSTLGLPDIITNSVTEITATSAICGGEILDNGGLEITDRGVCWCTSEMPTIYDNATCDGCGSGKFNSVIEGLIPGKEYYVRAYAGNSVGTNYGETKHFTTFGQLTDIDGNSYRTVKISGQWWMAENLKVTHYRNGDPIPEIKDNNEWITTQSGAYCCYSNAQVVGDCYGKLYNWHTVIDERGVAPKGWHVPSDEDWKDLELFLGLNISETDSFMWRGTKEGNLLKSTDGWCNNGNGTDKYNFHALPAGYRWYEEGKFFSYGDIATFWSSTEYNQRNAISRGLVSDKTQLGRARNPKVCGMSVRCIKN